MKKITFIITSFIITGMIILCSCNKLNGVLPRGILQDQDIFKTSGGIDSYFATLYANMPMEDYRFNNPSGYAQFDFIQNINVMAGEEINKNVSTFSPMSNNSNGGEWSYFYTTIREANYFMETLPKYATGYTAAQISNWTGEALFVRAFTYFEAVKRWGGVPLILTSQNLTDPVDKLLVTRNSEEECYTQIAADLDQAYTLLNATNALGRANKYVAEAFKCRVMLYGGSIAEYNTKNYIGPIANKRVEGLPASDAIPYFKAAYAASLLVAQGGYQLYRVTAGTDKVGNYLNTFFDASGANKEMIFPRLFAPTLLGSSIDAFLTPHQEQSSIGYTSYNDPVVETLELFDGLPKNPDGTLQTTDASGNFILYGTKPTLPQTPYSTLNKEIDAPPSGPTTVTDWTSQTSNNVLSNEYSIFATMEPRGLATIMVPGSMFRGEIIDIRRGIYKGPVGTGIAAAQFPQTSYTPYNGNANISPSVDVIGGPAVDITINSQVSFTTAGQKIQSGGLSGIYGSRNGGTITGLLVRKYANPNESVSSIATNTSYQPWSEIRYAEVELSRAEAGLELLKLGDNSVDYLTDAYNMIQDIRDRAGATPLVSPADLAGANGINIVRRERGKELCFENKTYWDLIRWRTFDTQINNRQFYQLNPFYVVQTGQYFYDRRLYEANQHSTFQPTNYYQQIPGGDLTKNPKIDQNQ